MMLNGVPLLAALLLAVGVAVVPSAGAATVAVRDEPSGGPVLTGHGVAWQAREARCGSCPLAAGRHGFSGSRTLVMTGSLARRWPLRAIWWGCRPSTSSGAGRI